MDLLISFAKLGIGVAAVIRNFVEEDLANHILVELPLPGTEVRIGEDNRSSLGGPTIAQGYRNVESRDFVDGWFATSDAQ